MQWLRKLLLHASDTANPLRAATRVTPDSATPVDEGEAQAAAARDAEELSAEVSAALERSVAGDGLLSSYVPFLMALALAYCPEGAADDAAAAAAAVLSVLPPPPLSAAALVSFGEFLKLSAALARRRLGAVVALARAAGAPDAVRCAAVNIWAACFARDEQGQGLYDLMAEGEESNAVRRKATRAVLSLLRQSRLKATQTHKLVRLSNDADDAVRGAVLRFLTRLIADQPTALRTALTEMYYAPLSGSKQACAAEAAARLSAATTTLSLLSCSGSAGATRGRDAAAAALASALAPRLASAAANREEGERTAALLALLPPTQATVEAASGALSTLKRAQTTMLHDDKVSTLQVTWRIVLISLTFLCCAQSNKTLQLLAVHFKNGAKPRGTCTQAPLEAARTIAAMLTDGADSDSGNASSKGRADNATATANGGAAADSSGNGSDDSDFETTRTAVKQLRLRQGGERGAKPQNQRTEHGNAQEQQQGAASRGATRGAAAAAAAAAVAAASESESEHERAVSGSKARSAAAAARDKGKSVSQRRAATSSPPRSSSGNGSEEASVVVTGRRKKGAAAARKRQRHVLVDSSGDDSAFE
ncbi:hypothetical protein JKP88DRAFT_254428 [Tribonema minus]|uniref:Uncharacterized protein n=1 Tax=Tribonema minus TaxID=303371 RepID=A0A836CHE6_9STRA|nr:hypothetical protein JKP88DRAFT_254428 [Tribonema minus]